MKLLGALFSNISNLFGCLGTACELWIQYSWTFVCPSVWANRARSNDYAHEGICGTLQLSPKRIVLYIQKNLLSFHVPVYLELCQSARLGMNLRQLFLSDPPCFHRPISSIQKSGKLKSVKSAWRTLKNARKHSESVRNFDGLRKAVTAPMMNGSKNLVK